MTEQDKKKLSELCDKFKKLSEADRIRITGIAEGMVFARELTATKSNTKEEEKHETEKARKEA